MNEIQEIWKDVPGYEGLYQVSNLGRVKSLKRMVVRSNDGALVPYRERILKHFPNNGYLCVGLGRDGIMTLRNVHTLVLEAFVGPCPEGMMCRHFPSRDKTDNRLCNLSWGTYQQNQGDRVVHNTDIRGEQQWKAKLTESKVISIRLRHSEGESISKLAKEHGVDRSTLRRVIIRETWGHV